MGVRFVACLLGRKLPAPSIQCTGHSAQNNVIAWHVAPILFHGVWTCKPNTPAASRCTCLELKGCQLLLGVSELLLQRCHFVLDRLQLRLLLSQCCIAGIKCGLCFSKDLALRLHYAVDCSVCVHRAHPQAHAHCSLRLLADLQRIETQGGEIVNQDNCQPVVRQWCRLLKRMCGGYARPSRLQRKQTAKSPHCSCTWSGVKAGSEMTRFSSRRIFSLILSFSYCSRFQQQSVRRQQ